MFLPITVGISPTLKIRGILAAKDIKKGEEIFINYNYVPTSKKKLDPGFLKKDKMYNAIID